MSKKTIIIGIAIGLVILSIPLIYIFKYRKEHSVPKNYVIVLGEDDYVKPKKKYTIKGTNDTIIITEKVEWKRNGTSTDSSLDRSAVVPYIITVDGQEYTASYTISDTYDGGDDSNPTYNVKVTDVSNSGQIRMVVNKK